jgi:hypothetical protein
MPSGDSMGLSAIFGEVPVFLGFSQKKKITIRELFPMKVGSWKLEVGFSQLC